MTKTQHDFLKASIERSNALVLQLQDENEKLKWRVSVYEQFQRQLKDFVGVSK